MSVATLEQESTIEALELRRAFGTFVTGVTVVTARDAAGAPCGMTANSFASVSLDPPLLLVCIGFGATSCRVFRAASAFAVNLLHDAQQEISALFAARPADKFAAVGHRPGRTGAPILTDCLSWFDCSVHQRVDAGDHMVLIGRVEAFGAGAGAPLAFCRGRYASLGAPR